MSDCLTTNPVTLEMLREAAEEVLAAWKPTEAAASFHTASAWNRYNGLRAEFWRLAYFWMSEFIVRDTGGQDELKQLREARAIIAEIEART